MSRLSFGVMVVLVAAIPAMTWSLVQATEMNQHVEEDEISVWRTASREDDTEGRNLVGNKNGQGPAFERLGDSSNIQEQDTQGQAESDRAYLNALVDTSTANADNQETDIAFLKTHKTGSATMAGILYRYAGRHDVKLAHDGIGTVVDLMEYADKVEAGSKKRVDIVYYHICREGRLRGSWSDAHKNYLRIMRDPDNVKFITVIREPRSHFISFYYYFLQPDNQLSLEEFLTKHPGDDDESNILRNTLAGEFGVTTRAQMGHFIEHGLSDFRLMFLTERFDEGLMVLRRLLGWDMIDMTYMPLNETKAGAQRFDGKQLVDKPSFEDLPEKVRNRIDALTMLDQLLYTAAQEKYAKRLQSVSDVIEADLEEFAELQNVVSDYLNGSEFSKAKALYGPNVAFKEHPRMYPF